MMVITGELFEDTGLHSAEALSVAELNNLPPIQKVQLANRLTELSGDFVFFNHGLLFTEAGFYQDPVEEFMLKKDNYEAVFAVEYSRTLFRGLNFPGDDTWNRVLMGCRIDLWPELYGILNNLVAVSRFSSKVYSCFMHNVYIPDPNSWHGDTASLKVDPSDWGTLCQLADKGLSGEEAYRDSLFPEGIPFAKIFVSGVSGPNRLSYMKSGLYPKVVYSEPESSTLALQGVMSGHVL